MKMEQALDVHVIQSIWLYQGVFTYIKQHEHLAAGFSTNINFFEIGIHSFIHSSVSGSEGWDSNPYWRPKNYGI